MNWNQFLTHPEVITDKFSNSIGKYLYGKILHDLLECLNTYKGFVDLIFKLDVTEELSSQLISWNLIVDRCVEELNTLWKWYDIENARNGNWESLIHQAGKVISQDIFQQIAQSSLWNKGHDSQIAVFANAAVVNLRRLLSICQDIEEREYLTLWKTHYKMSVN